MQKPKHSMWRQKAKPSEVKALRFAGQTAKSHKLGIAAPKPKRVAKSKNRGE